MESPKSGVGHDDFDALLMRIWAVSGGACRSIKARARDDTDPLLRVTITVSIKTACRMTERGPSKYVAKSTSREEIDGYEAGGGTAAGTGRVSDPNFWAPAVASGHQSYTIRVTVTAR